MKALWSLIVTVLCLIPLWLYLAANAWLDPVGFWQEFIMLGAGLFLLGAIQLGLLALLVFLLMAIWSD